MWRPSGRSPPASSWTWWGQQTTNNKGKRGSNNVTTCGREAADSTKDTRHMHVLVVESSGPDRIRILLLRVFVEQSACVRHPARSSYVMHILLQIKTMLCCAMLCCAAHIHALLLT